MNINNHSDGLLNVLNQRQNKFKREEMLSYLNSNNDNENIFSLPIFSSFSVFFLFVLYVSGKKENMQTLCR